MVSTSSRYRRAHPERMLLHNAKRRAKAKGIPFNLTLNDIEIPEVCPVLGMRLASNWEGNRPTDQSPTLDRIIPELGYTRGNVVVVSNRANRVKSNATVGELRDVARFYERRVNHPDFLIPRGELCKPATNST